MRYLSADNKQPIVRKMTPGYTKFNMSHSHKLSGDMGFLIPICTMPLMPGDRISIGVDAVMRLMPTVAPVIHEAWVTFDYYDVPIRILDDTFMDFITGGEDGLDTTSPPRWTPTNINKTESEKLWDYLGYPIDVIPSLKPVDWPRRAYYKIYNWHYRNQNLQDEINYETIAGAEDLVLDNWESDYFTQSFPWQQRGVAPALPVTGTIGLDWPTFSTAGGTGNMVQNAVNPLPGSAATENTLEAGWVDLQNATTFDISDLREAIQIQRFLEINARTGSRFNEFLEGQFNSKINDETLQQPHFIGRVSMPMLIDEVVSASETLLPTDGSVVKAQGTLSGKGTAITSNFAGTATIKEPSILMGIMCVKPKAAYQQGIDRPWLIQTKYDYPFPVFANMSEQKVMTGELYVDGTGDGGNWPGDGSDFAFVGRYDEYRIMHDSVHGLLKEKTGGFGHWHMGRVFSSQPANNGTFMKCDCSAIKARIMAVPSEPTFVANVGNRIEVTRALPLFANPSLMEHV